MSWIWLIWVLCLFCDCLKIAHYACLLLRKLREEKEALCESSSHQ